MSKHNANDMAMAWLDMKIHENPDSFDAINAENCLALIRKQRKQEPDKKREDRQTRDGHMGGRHGLCLPQGERLCHSRA